MKSSLMRSFFRSRALLLRSLGTSYTQRPAQFTRTLATDDRFKTPYRTSPERGEEPGEQTGSLFDEENVGDLSPVEVARMRVIYGLVKEHVEAHKRPDGSINSENNPMIDPRSFDIKTLPKLPAELLKHFRQELPADVASVSRPVPTTGIWESDRRTEGEEMSPEVNHERAEEWAIVDERTMAPMEFAQMQRQSFTNPDAGFRSSGPLHMPRKRKKVCPLQDERGRVKVDFRSVGLLSTYLTDNKKIMPKRKSGLSAKAQRKVATAVKTARTMALLDPEPKVRLTYEDLLEIERSL